MRVTKLVVMRSGTYNQMFARPYQTQYNANVADDLARRLDDNQNGETTGALLSGLANRIIMPARQHSGPIAIVNGWEMPRGRFMMVLEMQLQSGATYHYHIQGYTSHWDPSLNGTPDPDMRFYVNSFVRMSRTIISTPTGTRVQDIVTESAQVIDGRLISTQMGNNTQVYGMRPNEIYTVMQSDHLVSQMWQGDVRDSVYDHRTTLSNQAVPSSRVNNLPSNMLAKIIDTYQTGLKLANYGSSNSDVYSRCKGYVYEGGIMENPFFRQLYDITGMPEATSFTIMDILSIDPNAMDPSVAQFVTLTPNAMAKQNHSGQSEFWHRPDDIMAWICSVLINSVPTIMMEMMITRLVFAADNHDMSGINNVEIYGARDIIGQNIVNSLQVFKTRFVHEIMRDLTYNNQELYQLKMDVDLFGDTVIDIAFGGQPMTRYVTPSFCDSLMAPVVTTNKNLLQSNAYDFGQLLQGVNANHSQSIVNEGV